MAPIYEYECRACGQRTERERKIADRKKRTTCVHCKSRRTFLVPSTTMFALTGDGWASTGYQKGSPPKAKPKVPAPKPKVKKAK